MRRGRRLLAFCIAALSMGIILWQGKTADAAKRKVVFTNIEEGKLQLYTGKTFNVMVDKKKLGKNAKIVWKSSREKVATVSQRGRVKALAAGKTWICATIEETEVSARFRLKVRQTVPLKSVKIKSVSKYLLDDTDKKIQVTLKPSNTTYKNVVWKSSKKRVATVDERGVIHPVSAGQVTITAKVSGTKKKCSKTFTVRKNQVTKINIPKSEVIACKGKVQLDAVCKPKYATHTDVIWKSDNPEVAVVNASGLVTAKKKGIAQITAYLAENQKVFSVCKVTVSNDTPQLTKKMLDDMDLSQYNKLMIVAHPDDETIWGGAHLIEDEYLVVCLTNKSNAVRSAELAKAMAYSNDVHIILDYPDLVDGDKADWSLEQLAIQKDIRTLLTYKKWDLVVTHSPQGETGHRHHRKCNAYVTGEYKENPENVKQLMYFGRFYQEDEMEALEVKPPSISDELLEKKVEMLKSFESKGWTCFTWLWHMEPHEDWVSYDKWVQP